MRKLNSPKKNSEVRSFYAPHVRIKLNVIRAVNALIIVFIINELELNFTFFFLSLQVVW